MNTEDDFWNALVRRDPDADGRFLYSVRTTGVYCRPSCPSRLPRRSNVAFHAGAVEAEAAGFRPCKRCRPAEASAAARHLALIGKACAILRERERTPSLAELASEVGISRFHFHRLFKQITGTTPRDYARASMLDRFARTLDAGEPIAQAAYAAGFGSSSRAYESAATGLGMTPGARRRRGAGEAIRYTVAESTLGPVLVAATARGICSVAFGSDAATLACELRERFPAAAIAEDTGDLRDWAERVVGLIASPGTSAGLVADLPLDLRGTAFQAGVWRALQRIPPGRTASYAEVAAALGRPTAVRAVARACAGNPVALLVPCHRVVRSGGALGGYRWGVERKRALLEAEAAQAGDEPGNEGEAA